MSKLKLSVSAKNRLFRQSLKAVEALTLRLQTCPIEEVEKVKLQLNEERKILNHFAK